MAEHGSNPRDWTILPSGQGTGFVSCGTHRGWYKWNASNTLQITWTDGPREGPSIAVERAARAACAAVDAGDHQASKAGGLAAGG